MGWATASSRGTSAAPGSRSPPSPRPRPRPSPRGRGGPPPVTASRWRPGRAQGPGASQRSAGIPPKTLSGTRLSRRASTKAATATARGATTRLSSTRVGPNPQGKNGSKNLPDISLVDVGATRGASPSPQRSRWYSLTGEPLGRHTRRVGWARVRSSPSRERVPDVHCPLPCNSPGRLTSADRADGENRGEHHEAHGDECPQQERHAPPSLAQRRESELRRERRLLRPLTPPDTSPPAPRSARTASAGAAASCPAR